MNIKNTFTSIIIILSAIAHTSMIRAATLPPVIISEIQITGGTGRTADDFVELYNTSSETIDISNYRLRYKNSKGTEGSLKKIGKNVCLAAHGYYLWANKKGVFADIADAKTVKNIASNYSLALFASKNSNNAIIDSVSWGSKANPFNASTFHFENNPSANESMIRDITTGEWALDFSKTPTPEKSTDTSCPSNDDKSKLPEQIQPPPAASYAIRINEIFPDPDAKKDAGEFVEFYNFGTKLIDISGWILRDATKTGKYIFPPETIIAPSLYFVVIDQDFKFALNNSNETVSLFDNNENLVDSTHYEKTKRNVSLNYTATGWRGGDPTPEMPNQINNLPETKEKVPKKGYSNIPVQFNAKGKDADGDKLKYVWDFGDEHKSYKAKTSHTYKKNGTYTITLKTNDGKEDLLETFTIKIQSFTYPKIRITSFMPNPSGKDTVNEWIMLKNKGKKTVNLKGFSIATGWKNLVNHPIRKNFILKPKQETKLTRANSLFTLPNKKGKIELRAPDGKVLQKIKYKPKKSIAENAIYQKKKGDRWRLETLSAENISLGPENKENTTLNPAIQQLPNENSAIINHIPLNKEGDRDSKIKTLSKIRRARNRQWLKLVSLGTNITLSENIGTPMQNNKPVFEQKTTALYDTSFIQEMFIEINAYFNNTLNSLNK